MKPQTQNQRILAALRKGRTLTMLDIFRLCGSMNGHKRMEEIHRNPVDLGYDPRLQVWPVWVKRNGRKLRAWKLA